MTTRRSWWSELVVVGAAEIHMLRSGGMLSAVISGTPGRVVG